MKKLFKKVSRLGLRIDHAAEIGVWHPASSNIIDFIAKGCKADLFEADPEIINELTTYFKDNPRVRIFPYAIYNTPGRIGLYRFRASTFIQNLEKSPALINDKYKPTEKDLFYVEARLMSDFDDGTIDLLSIDTEGSEWQALQTLKSRPVVISIETHGRKYRNPFRQQILIWMKSNGYNKWYRTESDTVFIKKDIKLGFLDKLPFAF
jgi:FkbM family methyltransferase